MYFLSGGRKPAEHVKIALAVVSVLSVGIFIAFCTVLSLLIKGMLLLAILALHEMK